MHPLSYSTAIPAHIRVGQFVADEPRLAWVFKLLNQVPGSEAYVVGGSTRDAVKGVLPKGLHLVIRNVPLNNLRAHLERFGEIESTDDAHIHFKPQNFEHEPALQVGIPIHDHPDHRAPISYDLGRRDFTVNAVAYSINSGQVIDPFGGLKDLDARCLRCVGRPEVRLKEKPRRALRALRFASEHQYKIDNNTWYALQDALPSLNRIVAADDGSAAYAFPRAQIGHEFLRTLSGHPSYGFRLWRDSGASSLFTPELDELETIEHGNGETALMRSEKVLDDLGHPIPTLVFAALVSHLEDAALESGKKIIARLHLHAAHPDFNHADALWMLEHKNILEEADPEHMPASMFEKVFAEDRGQHLLTFLHATHRATGRHSLTRERLHDATTRRRQLVTDITGPKLLRGRDLEMLGVTPGPHYRKLLAKLRDAQLDGHISNREEALNYARNLLAAQIF